MRLRDKLQNLAAGITGNREDADDVLHDAFCKLWLRHREVKDELEATKLSYTAVRNSAIDELRHNRSHPEVPIETVGELSEASDDERQAENTALCEALLAVSQRVLKEQAYTVFMLHDVRNMTYEEIAAQLQLTQENVRQILSRARKKLRETYRAGKITPRI